MAKIRSAKAGQPRHGRGSSGRRGEGSFRAPLSAGANQQQPDLLSEVGERRLFSRFSDLTLMAFLAVGAALPYLNTLRNGFVSDDYMQVLHNPFIRNFHYLAKIFKTRTTSFPSRSAGGIHSANLWNALARDWIPVGWRE